MTTIQSQVQQIAAALRSQMGSLKGPAQTKAHSGQGKGKASYRTKDVAAQPQDLADVVAQRIQQVAIDDPLYKRKVFRVFLESVISAEFGGSVSNDLRFAKMIDSIQSQMETDPQLSTMMDEAVSALTAEKR